MVEVYGLSAGQPMTNFGSERLHAFTINGGHSKSRAYGIYEVPSVAATTRAPASCE